LGIVFRQAIKTSIVTFTGALLGAAINYIYTLAFPQNLVGVSRNLLNQGAVLFLFLLMGTVSLVHTYAQRYDLNDPKRPVLITYSLVTPLVTTGLFCIPYFLLKSYVIGRYQGFDRQYIEEFYLWLPILGLLLSYMTMLEYYLAAQMKLALGASMREVVLRVLNIILIALFYSGLVDFHQFVIGTVLVHLVPIVALYYFSTKTKGFGISFNWRAFSRDELYRVVHFSWYHMLITVTANLTAMLDVLLLGMLSPAGLKDVAVYNLAIFLISVLAIPHKAMSGAAFPKINEVFVNKGSELSDLFTRSAINIQIVSVGMWVLILANRYNAAAILPPGYEAIAPVFVILSIGRMMDMVTGLNTELISITNHYKFLFRLTVLLLICIIAFERIFIPQYGIYGAAWVATLTLAAFNVVKLIFLYKKMKLLPFTKQTLVILAIGLTVFLVNYMLPVLSSPVLDAVIRSFIIVLIYGGLLVTFRPSPDLTHFISQVRKNKRPL
jgi:O-antigen/teichoic acid export membrane protein